MRAPSRSRRCVRGWRGACALCALAGKGLLSAALGRGRGQAPAAGGCVGVAEGSVHLCTFAQSCGAQERPVQGLSHCTGSCPSHPLTIAPAPLLRRTMPPTMPPLAQVFAGYLVFRDPPAWSQRAIVGVARLSHIFQVGAFCTYCTSPCAAVRICLAWLLLAIKAQRCQQAELSSAVVGLAMEAPCLRLQLCLPWSSGRSRCTAQLRQLRPRVRWAS